MSSVSRFAQGLDPPCIALVPDQVQLTPHQSLNQYKFNTGLNQEHLDRLARRIFLRIPDFLPPSTFRHKNDASPLKLGL
jgi:hypothetical protein